MKCRIVLLSLLLLVAIGASVSSAQDSFLLSMHRAGEVEIGMTIDALHTKYNPQSTKLVARYPEGMFTPELEIYLEQGTQRGGPSIIVGIDKETDWIVNSIHVNDRRFRTAKGISVGTTLGDLRRAYKVDWIDFGEGPLVANVKEVGMSFELDFSDPPREWYRSKDQRLIPDSARVVSVYIYWVPDLKTSGNVRHR